MKEDRRIDRKSLRTSSPALPEEGYHQYLNHLIQGQRRNCQDIVQDCINRGMPVRELYTSLFQRSLYDIGSLWSLNRVSVATEHLVTSITEGLMALVYPVLFSGHPVDKSAVIACVAEEYHQVGAKMVADMFELYGWDGYFLGANTPISDLLALLKDKRPDIVGLSLSVYFNMPRLLEAITAVKGIHPQSRIIVGGHAFQFGGIGILNHYPEVTYVDSLETLDSIVGRHE